MKAFEINWAQPRELEVITLCEGHLYGDAGLKYLLHESGVFASESVPKILAGKDFDCGV